MDKQVRVIGSPAEMSDFTIYCVRIKSKICRMVWYNKRNLRGKGV